MQTIDWLALGLAAVVTVLVPVLVWLSRSLEFKPALTPATPPVHSQATKVPCLDCGAPRRARAKFCHCCGVDLMPGVEMCTSTFVAPALPPKTGGFVYRWCGPPKANDDLSALRNFVNSEPWVSVPGQWTTTTTTFRPPAC